MERLKQVLSEAANFTEMLHREREKRVSLKSLPPETEGVTPSKIRQGFIKEIRKDNEPFVDVRIRNENGVFTMTAKHRPTLQEATTRISKEMYEALWEKTRSKQEKSRYKLPSGWIVDDIKGDRVVAEYEYGKGKTQAHLPKGFEKA